MKAYHVFLLRHGMTDGNKNGQYIGHTDVPLCEEGAALLRNMKEKYTYPEAEAFFSSPLKRCVQTLGILYPDARVTVVPGLAECDFGDFEGKTLDDLKDDNGYKQWIAGAGKCAPPNGEASEHFQARSCAAFTAVVSFLMKNSIHTACITAHGGTLMAILSAFAMPRKPFYDWMAGNGAGFEVAITPQLWMNGNIIEAVDVLPYGMEEDSLAGCASLIDDFRRQNGVSPTNT